MSYNQYSGWRHSKGHLSELLFTPTLGCNLSSARGRLITFPGPFELLGDPEISFQPLKKMHFCAYSKVAARCPTWGRSLIVRAQFPGLSGSAGGKGKTFNLELELTFGDGTPHVSQSHVSPKHVSVTLWAAHVKVSPTAFTKPALVFNNRCNNGYKERSEARLPRLRLPHT